MGDQQTLTREQELAEEFKAGLSPDEAPQLAKRIADLEESNARLADQLEAAKKSATKAKAEAKVARGEAPAKARNIGPMGKDNADSLTDDRSGDAPSTDLSDAIAKADKVEIVFSDGKKEITGIPPVEVSGDVWKDHALGKMLRDPVEIEGGAPGGVAFAIDGYALLLDGKQVAYRKRSDQLNVAPGTKVSLADDIVF